MVIEAPTAEPTAASTSSATATLTPTVTPTDVLHWVLSDHLGSTGTTANQDGSFSSTIQYTAFGEIRVTKNTTLTKYRYTGQLAQAELGLDYYVARWLRSGPGDRPFHPGRHHHPRAGEGVSV